MRHQFGWDLPPGVTTRQIEGAFGEDYTCPKCEGDLEFVSGDFGTGVRAPDGVEEQRYEEGYYCRRCEVTYERSDIETEGE